LGRGFRTSERRLVSRSAFTGRPDAPHPWTAGSVRALNPAWTEGTF
jgi:hypothetical protein